MLFNSFEFLVFFILVTLSYFLLPHKFRWLLLLLASCYFYMAFVPVYILILFGTIVIDFFAGILIENATGRNRKLFLTASIIANVGVLAVFKYYNFFVSNINEATTHLGGYSLPLLKILLPIGLSFHTFQAMSYTIEVYRGNQKAERHFGIYALYVMFYPQLVAGPIERPQNMIHQFYEVHTFQWDRFHSGLKKMLWGFFKKVVIADRLALVVSAVYDQPGERGGLEIIIATTFFAFQVYGDFSGYTDIATGAAEIMGFKLMTNFKKPYFSSSMGEFWSRWHISLSTWFRDYLYIPIGGNRISLNRTYFNTFVVFVVSGFWHGANWNYILWGAVHGLFVLGGLLQVRYFPFKNRFLQQGTSLRIILNFGLLILTFIVFRATSIAHMNHLFSRLASGWHLTSPAFYRNIFTIMGGADMIYGVFNVGVGLLLIAFLCFIESISKSNNPLDMLDTKPRLPKWAMYYALVLVILVLGVYENKEFIYFQF